MKTIVITGSTRGIGFNLADAFLAQGCRVVISGRTQATVDQAVAQLAARHPQSTASEASGAVVCGWSCDVSQYGQVQALWDLSVERFGRVDIWVNNAGISNMQDKLWKVEPESLREVILTNLLGLEYGSRVAMLGMLAQGGGAIYNLGGLGSTNGRKVDGLTPYATTKAGIRYFTEALALEAKDTPVIIGLLRPGMVITDMLTKQYQGDAAAWARFKRILNILADRPETVTPWMAQKILENTRSGATLSYSGTLKTMWRFISAPFSKRKIID